VTTVARLQSWIYPSAPAGLEQLRLSLISRAAIAGRSFLFTRPLAAPLSSVRVLAGF